ncbi:hypothetical protein [Pandoravirus japonicus]|uniref:Uncharacterized protein n=1 Tax=Pandoravirus japonicus TaxID=2823154 RepID=A0A811BRF7_9VIRU|nr:hypothetical protein [Pandoravirus japonicus]
MCVVLLSFFFLFHVYAWGFPLFFFALSFLGSFFLVAVGLGAFCGCRGGLVPLLFFPAPSVRALSCFPFVFPPGAPAFAISVVSPSALCRCGGDSVRVCVCAWRPFPLFSLLVAVDPPFLPCACRRRTHMRPRPDRRERAE